MAVPMGTAGDKDLIIEPLCGKVADEPGGACAK